MAINKEEAKSQTIPATEEFKEIVAQASMDFITDVFTNEGLGTCIVISKVAKSFINIFNAIDGEFKSSKDEKVKRLLKQRTNEEDSSLN